MSDGSIRFELTSRKVARKGPLTRHDLLAELSEAMAELHERHHGRRPTSAKCTLMGDDLLACVLTGVYTEVEKTMIELGRGAVVTETRSAFYEALRDKLTAEVGRLSRRRVVAFFEAQHIGPDLEILLFLLAPDT